MKGMVTMLKMNLISSEYLKAFIGGILTDDIIFGLYHHKGVDTGLQWILESDFELDNGVYFDKATDKPVKVSEFVSRYEF